MDVLHGRVCAVGQGPYGNFREDNRSSTLIGLSPSLECLFGDCLNGTFVGPPPPRYSPPHAMPFPSLPCT